MRAKQIVDPRSAIRRGQPSRPTLLRMSVMAAVLLVAGGVLGQVVVTIKHPDRPATVIEVPRGSRVQVAEDGNVTVVPPAAVEREFSWTQIVSVSALEKELRAAGSQLDRDVTTLPNFLAGGSKKARQQLSRLALLSAILAKCDDRPNFRRAAAVATVQFAEAARLCKVGTQSAYQAVIKSKAHLASLLAGEKLAGEPSRLEWKHVVDRPPLMQWMDAILREELSPLPAESEFADQADRIQQQADLLAMIATVISLPEMPDGKESDYADTARQLAAFATEMSRAARQNERDSAIKAFGRMQKQCANCHENWRA